MTSPFIPKSPTTLPPILPTALAVTPHPIFGLLDHFSKKQLKGYMMNGVFFILGSMLMFRWLHG